MNNIDLTYGNGFPFENKTLDFMQQDYKSALKGLAGIGGNGDFIISGLVQTGNNVSAGWIYYQGDLIFFEAGVKQDTFIITDSVENKIYQDGVSHPAYITRHAKFGIGTSPIAFSTLKRLPSLLNMQSLITSIVNFESSVILDGCAISNVSVSPTTLTIGAGIVMIDNNILNMPGYTGQYPVFANADGNWVTAQPGTGSYIRFDPYTSQGKDSVIRRAVNRVGTVTMMSVLSDRFDGSGLGKWEMKGWAMMNGANGTFDIRGRFPISYDGRGADPGNNIWDANYQALGNVGGEKKHQLTEAELPSIDLEVPLRFADNDRGGNSSLFSLDNAQPFTTGNDEPHENRPPYLVLVFVQRIA